MLTGVLFTCMITGVPNQSERCAPVSLYCYLSIYNDNGVFSCVGDFVLFRSFRPFRLFRRFRIGRFGGFACFGRFVSMVSFRCFGI